MTKQIEKRNGKLTKREIVRRIYDRAKNGGAKKYAISYLARRMDVDVEQAFQICQWLSDHMGLYSLRSGRNVVFLGW